jgi:hypothetical protein
MGNMSTVDNWCFNDKWKSFITYYSSTCFTSAYSSFECRSFMDGGSCSTKVNFYEIMMPTVLVFSFKENKLYTWQSERMRLMNSRNLSNVFCCLASTMVIFHQVPFYLTGAEKTKKTSMSLPNISRTILRDSLYWWLGKSELHHFSSLLYMFLC